MKQVNESVSDPSEKPSDLSSTGENGMAGPFIYEPSGHEPINFHSAEFNCTDDLNDFSGNYRSFQTLDGVVTADMRHQVERRHNKSPLDFPVETAGALGKKEPEGVEAEVVETPVPLSLVSRGRTLIIDTKAERAMALAEILTSHRLTCTVVVTKSPFADKAVPKPNGPGCFEVEGLSLSGAFGGFLARATNEGDQKNLNEAIGDRGAVFDLVLDLQSKPSYAGDCLPMGYYATGERSAALEEAMAELPEMRGQFKKLQFTSLLKNRCFHGRSPAHDCRRCLEICPFGAIRSLDRKISIDPFLCQGCGGCVLVCPAEAIRLNEPSPEDLLNQLQIKLENRSIWADFPITLVIFDSEWSGLEENSNNQTVYFKVDQIAHVGMEMPLAALAYGAGEVLVVSGSQNSPGIKKALEGQMQMARSILQGLGLQEGKIRLVAGPSESLSSEKTPLKPFGQDGPAIDSPKPPATFSPGPDRRKMVRLVVQHLYDQSGIIQPEFPLPMGSPFGAISVDGGACTLCLACVTACPSKALSAGGQVPQLKFRESLCHQCGLCQETCPEGAIHLLPRLFCDHEAIETPVILEEAEPFRCIKCGLPFATPAMIDRMEEKLQGHWMYADERQLRRLRMCGTCRARDALMSEDMRLWNQQ